MSTFHSICWFTSALESRSLPKYTLLLSTVIANTLNAKHKLASKGHCKVLVWVNENMLLSWIIARRYWSDELVVWWPIGWQELLLITKELLDLYISRNTVASEPCAMKSFRIYLPISAFIASFLEGKSGTITNSTILSYTIHRDKLFCRSSHHILLYLNNLSKHV